MALSGKMAVRVVSYNVLSSHLASPSHYTTYDPEHLDAKTRLSKVLAKLEQELTGKQYPTIFCLQEVSHDWAGHLHTFFANKNYHFVTALYGKKFNGYMGIAVAYPLHGFETVSVDLCRLSDKRIGGWPRPPRPVEENNGPITQMIRICQKVIYQAVGNSTTVVRNMLPFLGGGVTRKQDEIEPWEYSEWRQNMLITLKLRFKTNSNGEDGFSSRTFCISNYHMPCAFYAPAVMNIHVELAAKRVQTLAGADPYILAGDFNILPNSVHYILMTSGFLSHDDPSYPPIKHGMEWTPSIVPMRSAYELFHGKEPDFTNYAKVKEEDPFIGTLDYIFVSQQWRVLNVKDDIMVHRDEVKDAPYPNAVEPSDHVLIAADLEIESN